MAAAFFCAGAFFAAAFFAGAFLAGAAAGLTAAAGAFLAALLDPRPKLLGDIFDASFDVVEALGKLAELLADLGLDEADDVLGRRAATLDELLHGLLGILAAHLAGLHEIGDELFGVLLRHLGVLHAGVEQTLEYW